MKTERKTSKAHKFHATQEAYMLALATYEQARDAAKADCSAKGLVIVDGMTDEAWETTSNAIDDVEIAHGVWALQTAKVEAERAMILWSLDATEATQMPGSEAATTIAFMRDRMSRRIVRADEWTRLVDLGSRLAA
jgi:hypothetical protein